MTMITAECKNPDLRGVLLLINTKRHSFPRHKNQGGDIMLKIGEVVYTTRRNPFSNKARYRKGKIVDIEYSKTDNELLIWCKFHEGTEAFIKDDIDKCLFTNINKLKSTQKTLS